MQTRDVYFLRLFRNDPEDLGIQDMSIVAWDEVAALAKAQQHLRERWDQERLEAKPSQGVLYALRADGEMADLYKLKVLHDTVHHVAVS